MPCARSSATTLSRPFFSMVRMPLVVRRSVTQRFSVSSQKRCVCRFGRKRRRFLLLAWETRLPTAGFLPVTSQTRDIHATLREIRYLEVSPDGPARLRAGLYTSPAAGSQGARVRKGVRGRGDQCRVCPPAWGPSESRVRAPNANNLLTTLHVQENLS